MNFSNEEIAKIRGDGAERFDCSDSKRVVFDFHDGMERGLLLSPDGSIALLDSLADSESRLERAFELRLLKRDLAFTNRELLDYLDWLRSDTHELSSNEQLKLIERSAYSAVPAMKFLAIAPISIKVITLTRTNEREIDTIRSMTSNKLMFNTVEALIQGRLQ